MSGYGFERASGNVARGLLSGESFLGLSILGLGAIDVGACSRVIESCRVNFRS